jgi:hypothetical protein
MLKEEWERAEGLSEERFEGRIRMGPPNTGEILVSKERRRADGICRRSKEEEWRVAETGRVCFCFLFGCRGV